jgi:hypothetical protein
VYRAPHELANFSVCTTLGLKDQRPYLLDVFRRKLDFSVAQAFRSPNWRTFIAEDVLVDDKASGTSLIQELRGVFLAIQAVQSASPTNSVIKRGHRGLNVITLWMLAEVWGEGAARPRPIGPFRRNRSSEYPRPKG